ncbi:MAG: hypothetical protein WBG50_03635 [Desulfomonilaceae bacterium]
MNGQHQRQGMGIGWIILLVMLYIIFNPLPGPFDDAVVATVGGYQALRPYFRHRSPTIRQER